MSAARRNRELANDLARRALAAAEKRRAEEAGGEAAVERLRDAAGTDGRLTVDEAIVAISGDEERPAAFNELLRAPRSRPPSPWPSDAEVEAEPETTTKPQGGADGGKGEADDTPHEYVQTDSGVERMEVFDLNKLDNPKEDQ